MASSWFTERGSVSVWNDFQSTTGSLTLSNYDWKLRMYILCHCNAKMMYISSTWAFSANCIFVPRLTKWGRGTIEFAIVCPSVRPSVNLKYLGGKFGERSRVKNISMLTSPKNTIILSRRGTLELRVHWSFQHYVIYSYIGPAWEHEDGVIW